MSPAAELGRRAYAALEKRANPGDAATPTPPAGVPPTPAAATPKAPVAPPAVVSGGTGAGAAPRYSVADNLRSLTMGPRPAPAAAPAPAADPPGGMSRWGMSPFEQGFGSSLAWASRLPGLPGWLAKPLGFVGGGMGPAATLPDLTTTGYGLYQGRSAEMADAHARDLRDTVTGRHGLWGVPEALGHVFNPFSHANLAYETGSGLLETQRLQNENDWRGPELDAQLEQSRARMQRWLAAHPPQR